MSFYIFKQIPITLNNNNLIVESIELSQNIELSPTFYIDNIISPSEQSNSMWKGELKIQYYLTGTDPLKTYMYSDELDPISGYAAGLGFSQGFLSNYSIDIQPNSPVMVNATIEFFDQLTGTLSPSTQISNTGFILRTSDVQINNLQDYTQNILNDIIKAKFDYSCKWIPSYNYYDSGIPPTKADYVSINERTTEVSVTSDNTNFTIPLSGENFGIIFTFVNPYSVIPINLVSGNYGDGTELNFILEPSTYYWIIFGPNEYLMFNGGGVPPFMGTNSGIVPLEFFTANFVPGIALWTNNSGTDVSSVVYNQLITGQYETFGISGKLMSKILNISTQNHHTHELKISNKRVYKEGYIQSVQTTGYILGDVAQLNPLLNTDITSSGIASADQELAPAFQAFDGRLIDSWVGQSGPPHWLQFQFTGIQIITSYSIIGGIYSSDGMPIAWDISGSTNGTSWNLLDSQNNPSMIANNVYNFNINNPDYYSYYRMYVTQIKTNGGNNVNVAEWNLYGPTGYFQPNNPYSLIINFNNGSFPLLSKDSSLSYINKISIGDTVLTGYSVNRTASYDQIIAPIPPNINNNSLLINTSYGNYSWQPLLQFSYPSITVTGVSQYSGQSNIGITISGTNFYRISNVLFGGVNSTFQVIDPQTISAITPTNGISSPITIFSNDWNKSGISPNTFFFQPQITYTSPVTGQWKDFIDIGGTNFTGTTGVYFNKTPAYNWYLLSNNIISAQTPETGQPYPLGYIYVYGSGGSTKSLSIYNPIVPIYGFYPGSGWDGSGMAIFTKIDTGYLYPFSGGYKSRIGDIDTPVYISGNNSTGILTGIIPTGAVSDYVFLYAPDGIRTYASSQILNINGIPIVESVSPSTLNAYQSYNLVINGQSLQYFDSNSFLAFYGHNSGNFLKFDTGHLISQVGGNSLLANNIAITGATGYYDVIVKNIYGSGVLNNGIFIQGGFNFASWFWNASNTFGYSPYTVDVGYFVSSTFYPLSASYAVDGNPNDYAVITITSAGYVQNHLSFISLAPVNIYSLQFIINQNVPNPETIGWVGIGSTSLSQIPSGYITFYQSGNNINPVYTSPLTNFSGGFVSNTPINGVTKIELWFWPFPGYGLPYFTGNVAMLGYYYMAVNEMMIYGSYQ